MTTLPHHRKRAATGFTLVELLVTIIVATILISIAIPSYQNQVRKSRRTEAKTALLDLAAREERYASTNSAYTADVAKLGFSSANWPVTVGSGYYQLAICVGASLPCSTPVASGSTANGAVYTLTATPVSTSPQSKDTSCATFSLDNTGAQTATNAACWQ